MKRFVNLTVLLFSFFLLSLSARASHMMGVDLTYECINNCTIRVHLRAYRDCSGITYGAPTVSFVAQTPGCGQPTAVGAWSSALIQEVTPLCPGASTQCTTPGASIIGVEEYYWWRDYDICSVPGCIYTMQWSSCCRNSAITSLTSGGSNSLGVFSTSLNTNITPCNSSPQFVNPPVPYICAGQPFTFNQGAYDPEGDSLVYSIGPCYQTATTTVTYAPGFSSTAPLGPSWNVTINSATGDITVTPQPGNIVVAVFCVYVQEYRNGVLMNTIVRDIQMTVLSCPLNNLPTVNPPQAVVGGSTNGGYSIYTCAGSSLCFQIPTADPNTTQTVTTWWSQNLPGATFTLLGNPSITDTLTGTPGNPPVAVFCWTPPSVGSYSFLVTTIDDACPIYGSNQFTVTIVVGNLESSASLSPAPGCGAVVLCADSVNGTAPYTYVWSGGGGLSGNPNATDSCLTHNYPNSGTFQYILQVTDSNGCIGADTGTVTVQINVNPDAGPDTDFCSGASGTIGSSPLPNYTYSWSPTTGLGSPTSSQTSITLNNTTNAPVVYTYIQTATDNGNGCTASDTVAITVYPQVTLNATSTINSCFNGNDGTATVQVLTGTGPYSFLWNGAANNQTTQTATNLHAGTYSVGVVDSAGCSATISVAVAQPSQVSVLAGAFPTTCFGGADGRVTASASGGTGPYTYLWQPINIAGPNIVGLPAGTYQVVVTDANGCTATASATVTEPPLMSITTSSTPTSCALPIPNGTAGVIATSGTPGYTYLWSDGQAQTTQYATGLAAGNYTVTVTDANGCTVVGSVTVGAIPPPTVSTGPDVSFCEGEGGTGILAIAASGTPGYWYSWTCATGNCGLSNVNSPNPNANPTVSQYYYVQVTDTNGCVSNIDSVFVTVLPKPIVDAGPDIYLCGDSAPCQIIQPTITGATGPYIYNWFPSLGLNDTTILNPCARPDTTTAYTLVVTAGNGCTSDYTTTDTLSTVVVHVNPIPIADAGPDRDVCEGDSTILEGLGFGAGPAYDYEWSPGAGLSTTTDPNPFAFPALTTTYTLVVWSNGCPSYGDQVVVNVHTNPTVDAGPDREVCLNDQTLLDAQAGGDSTATYTFFWWPDVNISSQTAEDPTVSPVSTTTYYVQATSNFGCESPVDSVLLTLLPSPVAEAGDNVTICSGTEAQLNGSYAFTTTAPADPNDIFFTWTPGATLSSTTTLDPIATPTASGYYHLTVYTGLCSTEDSVFVTVIPEIGLTLDADTAVLCNGTPATITASSPAPGVVITWSPVSSLNTSTGTVVVANPTTTTTYTAAAAAGGCVDTASITIQVLPMPEMGYISSQDHGCAPHNVSFMQTVANGVFYTWNFGDGTPVSNQPTPMHVYERPGTYNVTLTAAAPGGCEASISTMNITVVEKPEADFISTPWCPVELSLPNTSVAFANESRFAESYIWDFGDGFTSIEANPSHTFNNVGEFMVTLTAINAEGCADTVTHGPYMIVTPELFIPNVFSPNGDGVNDIFLPIYSGSQPYTVNVYDRWGVKMYESNNKVNGWDGKDLNAQDATDGVYYYMIKISDREFSGPVTLMR